jgi:CHAT domain-containing protein
MGVIYNRLSNDLDALRMFDQARLATQRLGAQGDATLLMIENNRAIHLRNLGRFQAALDAGDAANVLATRLGQMAEAARVQQNQAYIHIALGRYNEALQLLGRARDALWSDGRTRDVLMVDLDIIDCWLQLGRFDRVLETCQQVRRVLARSEAHLEVAQTILNEGIAYAGLQRYLEALDSLDEACRLFEQAGQPVWVATARLEAAAVCYRQAAYADSLETAGQCAEVFRTHPAPLHYAQACLVAARAAAALCQPEQAAHYVDEVWSVAQDIPALTYQAHYLLGTLAESGGRLEQALGEYDQAIREIEQLRGRMMVEYRSGFVADKQAVYEDAVRTCVALGQPARALEVAEQAKSRALVDLLSSRLDLSVQPRTREDQPLVDALNELRVERDRLYRRWESQREELRGTRALADEPLQEAYQSILSLERQITDRWHDLLVRNAGYARDATLWQPQAGPIQPFLDEGTALLEYFAVHGQVYAFVATKDEVKVRVLAGSMADIERWRQKLQLNFRAVAASPQRAAAFGANARGILQHLHELLIAPVTPILAGCARLVIVPHGPLHRLPFHALHDGNRYLIEEQQVSYLPSASLLCYLTEARSTRDGGSAQSGSGVVALGSSVMGRLRNTVQEARAVAAQFGGQAYVEDEATLAQLRQSAAQCRLLHLATHAEFRPDNPLFSYLSLHDGQLTALDIFSLRLSASLVTLSACETGESTVGGGDELHGLARAFLYAGAGSLVLSGWAVEDRFTAELMHRFYGGLVEGQEKGPALRAAQLPFLHDVPAGEPYAHPHFWAAFSLMGDWGRL